MIGVVTATCIGEPAT